MKNSSYYIAPVGDRTHDLPHTVASNMVKVSHALNHSATEAVLAIISSFKSKASSGHDGVSSKLVKDLKYSLAFPLLSIIINNSLAKGLVPNMAKLAKIIPIYKAKDKKNISNYRPISLLTVISKVLEKVVHKNVYTFLEKNKVMYASKYGK